MEKVFDLGHAFLVEQVIEIAKMNELQGIETDNVFDYPSLSFLWEY